MDVAEVVPEIDEEKEDTKVAKILTAKFKAVLARKEQRFEDIAAIQISVTDQRSPSKFQNTAKTYWSSPNKILWFASLSKFTLKRYLDTSLKCHI